MKNIYDKFCGIYIESHNIYTSGDVFNLVPREIGSNTGTKLNSQQQEIWDIVNKSINEVFPLKRSFALLNRRF